MTFGGGLQLTNATEADWVRDKNVKPSDRIDFGKVPDVIPAGTTASIHIEMIHPDGYGYLGFTRNGGGKLLFTISGREDQSRKDFNPVIWSTIDDIAVETQHDPAKMRLGWRHDGWVDFILVGTAPPYKTNGWDASNFCAELQTTHGSKQIRELCFVGSHDAGMSTMGAHRLAPPGSILTQSHPVAKQLKFGARYFDLRPVISNGAFVSGHYNESGFAGITGTKWLGGNGQSIRSIIDEINSFMVDRRELVVLTVSNTLNTDNWQPLNDAEWEKLVAEFERLDNRFVPANDTQALFGLNTLDDYIASSSSTIVFIDSGRYEKHAKGKGGFAPKSTLGVKDSYAHSDDFDTMKNDQLAKMKKFSRDRSNPLQMFLLSWTLTQTVAEAVGSVTDSYALRAMADEANSQLFREMFKEISDKLFPNIVYTDNLVGATQSLFAQFVNHRKELDP